MHTFLYINMPDLLANYMKPLCFINLFDIFSLDFYYFNKKQDVEGVQKSKTNLSTLMDKQTNLW